MSTAVERSREWRERAAPHRGYVPGQVVDAVRAHRDELLGRLSTPPPATAVAALRAATAELRLLAEHERTNVRRTGGEIQRALRRLRRVGSGNELLRRAPGELRRSGGFTRVMLSRVDGPHWIPLLPPAGRDAAADLLRAHHGDPAVLTMQHRLIEADVVRRRSPARVEDAATNPRCDPDLVRLLRTEGYVAAPIVSGHRVVGLVHADRQGQDVPLASEDLEAVHVFARHVGVLHDRVAMAAVLTRRHDDIARRQATMSRELSILAAEEVLLLPPAASDVWRAELEGTGRTAALPPAGAITAREREILALLQTGATNATIAQRLVISENTVKTHVARASRKLGARSRAECVARWLQIVGQER